VKLKKELIKILDTLEGNQILEIYDFIQKIALQKNIEIRSNIDKPYLKVRQALKTINYSLSDDIIADRDDRI
jgi:hypothetical protein